MEVSDLSFCIPHKIQQRVRLANLDLRVASQVQNSQVFLDQSEKDYTTGTSFDQALVPVFAKSESGKSGTLAGFLDFQAKNS
ncbi:MAG: hypothetical protein WAX44_04155 [Minisyncoccia bacterium]